jgi:hypothetical protein
MTAPASRRWKVIAGLLVAAFAIAVGWVVERLSAPPPPPHPVGQSR